MSGARSKANQSLYLGKILLGAWQHNLGEENIPASTLQMAFHPAVVMHLQAAYGWFLLELADVEVGPAGRPPAHATEVPPQPEGRAQCAELRELQGLEQQGFLRPLQQPLEADPVQRSSNPNVLITAGSAGPGIFDLEAWVKDFEQICERMRNSLDEC